VVDEANEREVIAALHGAARSIGVALEVRSPRSGQMHARREWIARALAAARSAVALRRKSTRSA